MKRLEINHLFAPNSFAKELKWNLLEILKAEEGLGISKLDLCGVVPGNYKMIPEHLVMIQE